MAEDNERNLNNENRVIDNIVNIQVPEYSRVQAVSFIEALDVADVISGSGKLGMTILESYNKSNPHELPRKTKDQKLISRVVGDAGLKINSKLSVTDIRTMAQKICDTFINEEPETYFQVKANGQYSGYLWHYVKKKKSEILKIRKSIEVANPDEELYDENIIENKNFLDLNTCEPWERVKHAWTTTRALRLKDLQLTTAPKRKKSKRGANDPLPVQEFFNNWPSLKHPSGYELIHLDFGAWYPGANNLTIEKLDQLIHKLEVLRSKKKENEQRKWAAKINNLKQLILSKTTSINVKNASKIKMLSFLIPPHGRANRNVKTTVVDGVKSMILHVKTAQDVDDAITTRSEYSKTLNKKLQPILVVVGPDWEHLEEFICCINDVKWKCPDFMKGLDTIFKSFFVLDTKYPFESEVNWGVIQRFIYGVPGQVHSEAVSILVNLKNIPDKQAIVDEIDPDNHAEVLDIIQENINPQLPLENNDPQE